VETGAQTGLFARISGSELLMDVLSCIPLSGGLLAAVLTATELDGGLGVCLVACAASVVVIALLSRRWWIFAGALFALAAAWLATTLLTGGFADSVRYLGEFISWVMQGAPHLPYAIDAGFTSVIFTLVVIAVTAPLFALLRRFFYFPIFLALEGGAVIMSAVTSKSDLSAAVCLGAAGLILLLPRVFAAHIEKMGDTASDKAELAGLSRARMQAVAIPAAVLSVLFAMWIIPEKTDNWKSYLLNAWIEDVRTLFTGRYREPPLSGARFSLDAAGYNTVTGRLGGPVTLNDDVYLMVQAPHPVLLKGSSLDYYDGTGWRASRPEGDLRFSSLLWLGDKNEAFDVNKPVGGTQARRLYDRLTDDIEILIVNENTASSTLFTAGHVYGISPGDRLQGYGAYFNRRSDVFTHIRVPYKAQYTVRTRVWNTRMDGFDELFTQLEEQTQDKIRFAAVSEQYTQLPDDLPGDVRDKARAITEGIASPYLKAKAISYWLAENCNYTLRPVIPPEDVDFTAHFLDTREGYCVYYATAMAVLARCAGLPARYVQGFALIDNSPWGSYFQYRATGLTAHAWSEVYFEGIGWMTFDPLSWDVEAPLNEAAEEHETPPTAAPSPTPSYAPPEDLPEGSNSPESREARGINTMLVLLISGLVVLALYFAYAMALRTGPRRMARLWTLQAVRRRYDETPKQLDALYNDTVKLLALQGLVAAADETLVTFPERVDRTVALDGGAFADSANAMMALHFGNIAPSDEDIGRACSYHSNLEALALETLGKRKYLFKRVMRK